jgi:hypothetical protein
VLNNSNAMWESLIESTDLKRHTDLFHLFYSSVFFMTPIRVDHSILVIFFQLIIFLLEIVEVVEEGVHGGEALVTLILFGGLNFAFLKFLLLNIINLRFDGKSVHDLNMILLNLCTLLGADRFKVFDLLFKFLKSLGYREG